MFTFPIGHFSSDGLLFLDSVISSVVCDLDATLSSSYGGSGQTWANVIAAPADSSAKTDYDFFRGLDGSSAADDPTFTGSAGDSDAHFLLDGGDVFKLVAGSNPSLFKDMHKTTGGPDFWLAMAFRFSTGGTQVMHTTTGANNAGNYIRVTVAPSGQLKIQQEGDGSAAFVTHVNLVDDTNYLIIISHSHSTNKTRFWVNETTATEVSHTFQTTTTDPNDTMGVAARGNGGQPMANNTRIYGFYAGNSFLSDADASNIKDHLEARHNRTYVEISVIWHCNYDDDLIHELSTTDFSSIRNAATPGVEPFGVGGTDSVIWHCDFTDDLIYELSTSDFSTVRSAASPSSLPFGIGGSENTIWHVDVISGLVYELSTTDFSVVRSDSNPGGGLRGIGGTANVIWHCNLTSTLIYELSTADFSTVRSSASPAGNPVGIGGSDNIIWHADETSNLVYELSTTDFSVIRSAASPATNVRDIGGS